MTLETSDDFKREAYAQETDNVFITLLTFSSDELDEDIYITEAAYETLPLANVDGVVSNGIEYIYTPYDIRLPRDDATGTVSAKLIVDNVARSLIATVRSISSPVTVTVQVVLSRDPDYVEREYDFFQLTSVSYDAFTIEGQLTLDYWGLEPFPSGRFTPSGFPGLF